MGKSGDPLPRRRFDGPHSNPLAQPAPLVPPTIETLRALAGSEEAMASEQLQRQAGQIAERLRSQLREIDSRESEFNARVAMMENELRTARLVFREREHSIEEQRLDFERRLKKLNDGQALRFDDGEASGNLASLPPAVVGEFQPGAIPTATPITDATPPTSRQRFQHRLQELEVQENLLKSRLASISTQQQQLDQQQEELENERYRLADVAQTDRQKARREFDQERLKLRGRADELERRSIAVKQMQADTTRMHREAVELRICTEGLIGQLQESSSPAEVAQRLAELRRQLDDQYQLANQSLKEQQQELERLIAKLAKHESRIGQQREEVRGWVARRQAEIEEQAKKLLQRERQLSKQEASFRSLESEWQLQRDGYEQQIRQLKRQLAA